MDKKIAVVTGGAGFIGSHLCERLNHEGYRVISLDNYFTGSKDNHVDGVEYREGHTKNIDQHISETPDILFHLGEYSRVEQSFDDIEKVWDLNKHGTFAVLEFCRKKECKIVYAGSSTKFGDDGLGRDQSPYAWVKATNTELVRNYSNWFGIKFAITYFYNVYGPREISKGPYATVIAIFKEEYKNKQPITIVSPGTQTRNFTHVEDIVNGLFLVGEKGEGDGYGIGNEKAYSIKDVASFFGGDIVMLPERKGNRAGSPVESKKTINLGWSATKSLEEDITLFMKDNTPKGSGQKKIIVFGTTFYPHEGTAEKALRKLIESTPGIHFDVITTKFERGEVDDSLLPKNVSVYRVGRGNVSDKFLLPFLGASKAKELMGKHSYLFAWSLFASYGAITALFARKGKTLPLLITLADQRFDRLAFPSRILLKWIVGEADQVHSSEATESKYLAPLKDRIAKQKSFGDGDVFANQIRFAYANFLNEK